MSSQPSVFLIGPGFIGWNVLDLLVSTSYKVTTLARRESHAEQLRASGAQVILSDLDDTDTITVQAAAHDITIHTATADHLPSVQAVLSGLRLRAKEGKHSIFIHTSGTNITADGAAGAFKSDRIYHDSKRSEIDAVGDFAPHRFVDVPIAKAAAEPELARYAKIAIIIPPTIYGTNHKHKRVSIQWPTIVRAALKHGFVGYVGEGASVESQIHVLDLARAYLVLLEYLRTEAASSFLLDNPYFFCENGVEVSWKDVSAEIARVLYESGKIKDPEAKTLPKDLYGDLFGEDTDVAIGLNSRSRAERLRRLGWEAKEKGWKDSLREDEVPLILME